MDDRPFHVVTRTPWMELVQGSARHITADILLTVDDDTPAENIIYQLNTNRPPTNGYLRHAHLKDNEHISQFSQLDVDQLKISFVSDGTLDNSSFYFYVSDGAHKSTYIVRGAIFTTRLSNNHRSFTELIVFIRLFISLQLQKIDKHLSLIKHVNDQEQRR